MWLVVSASMSTLTIASYVIDANYKKDVAEREYRR